MTSVTMFLQQLPDVIRWLLFFVIGTAVGSLVNLAIYQLALRKRSISPWSPTPDSLKQKRGWLDCVPVLGWFSLRRESSVHGAGFWIRPLLIELALGIGLALYFDWHMDGGLYGGAATKLVAEQAGFTGSWTIGWFLFHSVLIAMMVAATFIDFDEQTIPDWITIPGTVFALICLSLAPALRLPLRRSVLLKEQLVPLNYWTPDPVTDWHTGWPGILVSLLIIAIWCFALTPK